MYRTLAETRTLSGEHNRKSELSSGEMLFRPFRPDGDDEREMRDLVFNNAFLGQPFDVICPCKQWFGDVVLTPYIKYQPEHVHVAVHQTSGRLVGYLTGSMEGQQFERSQYNWVRQQVMSLAVSLTMPWTFFDQSSRLFAMHVIFKGERERPSHPQSGVHWHYQVDKGFRGQGVGRALLRRFTDGAIRDGFKLIWAEVMAYPEKPPEYFEDRGWSIYDAKPTGIFGDHVDFPVEVLCITKPLSEFEVVSRAARPLPYPVPVTT
jgi:GNAT superfamily N-acetyltransferase